MSRVFAASSLLFLAVLAISPAKSYFTEWRHYQLRYNRVLAQQPVRLKPIQAGIRQIWLPELERVDRCTSCHLGVGEAALKTARQPFRTHPEIPHDVEELGCTICHGGQGRATSYREAHGLTKFWDQPLFPREYVEASCGRCHAGVEVPEAPTLNRGRLLLEKLNCAGCHELGNIARRPALSLDGIGAKTTRRWLVNWLQNPRAFRAETRMPDFRLSTREAENLADFLMTFRKPLAELESLPEELAGGEADESLIALGQTRFREARCISCHAVEGKGGYLAPDLAKVASKVKPQWLYTYLGDPKHLHPGVAMPQYGFSARDRMAVTAYMRSEFVDWDAEEDTGAMPQPAANSYEEGLKLFNHYNCWGCHELSGVRREEEKGPVLSYVGSRRLYALEFGPAPIERTLPSYLYHKLQDPRQFLPNARMPDFGLEEKDLRALVTALLSMRKEPVPAVYRVPAAPASQYEPGGEFGRILEKYSCFSCHTIQGRGFRLATDLSREGSRVQRQWLKNYFALPYSLRPILRERMPNLFISPAEIRTVVDYMNLVLVDDDLDRVPVPDSRLEPRGRKLFFEKYGCQACHQVGGKGGYVGPPLDQVGIRLKPGWIYRWLEDPQRYRPDTLEPNAGLDAEELSALTAYLLSLK